MADIPKNRSSRKPSSGFGGKWNGKNLLHVCITLSLIGFGFFLVSLAEGSLTHLLFAFGFIFLLSNTFNRLYFNRGSTTESTESEEFEVRTPEYIRVQMYIVFFLLTVAVTFSFFQFNIYNALSILLVVALIASFSLAVIFILPIVNYKVTVFNDYLKIENGSQSPLIIPLISIEEVRLKKSFEAKISLDRVGDILVIYWKTNEGKSVENTIKVNRLMTNRELLFSRLGISK